MLLGCRTGQRVSVGFTLVELMVVISIILIVSSIAAPSYQRHLKLAREAALRENLYQVRMAIGAYTLDRLHAPQSLDDLVQAGCLPQIPLDPITNSRETWVAVAEDAAQATDPEHPGIADVRSGSTSRSSDGSSYSSW